MNLSKYCQVFFKNSLDTYTSCDIARRCLLYTSDAADE